MRVPDRSLVLMALLAVAVVVLGAAPALAYVGPGAGLELVGYFASLLAWASVVFSAVFLYPLYALLRRVRGRNPEVRGEQQPAPAPEKQDEVGTTRS